VLGGWAAQNGAGVLAGGVEHGVEQKSVRRRGVRARLPAERLTEGGGGRVVQLVTVDAPQLSVTTDPALAPFLESCASHSMLAGEGLVGNAFQQSRLVFSHDVQVPLLSPHPTQPLIESMCAYASLTHRCVVCF
jgi:hypothetical protein